MVLQTVHNSVLCNLVRLKRGYSCREQEAVKRQVNLARKIESFIDKRAGEKDGFVLFTPQSKLARR